MNDPVLQEIKDRLPITEVLQDYITLKKAGVNFKAVCPFHSEKTPSFVVSPAKGIWHCFGCGLGGDIFEFVKQAENTDFPGALRILADRAGVELRKQTPQEAQQQQKSRDLYEINDAAAKYYERVLWESESSKEALEYLRKRGLSDKTIQNWRLGYSPDDFHYLENFLSKRYHKEDLVLAGLIVKKDDKNEYFDRFRGRIMFPILNIHGQVVGFTGRLLHEKEGVGKYINSPETPVYNKSHELYGLYQAKNAIRKLDQVILVEGNMDAISCHQAGSNNVVATSGTALTNTQATALGRITRNIIFAFDADAAGTNTNRKALEWALTSGFNAKIVDLGTAKDPDELIKRSIGLWTKAVNSAQSGLEFFLNKALKEFDPSTVDNVNSIKNAILPLLALEKSEVTKSFLVRKLSDRLNVSEKSVWDELSRIKTSAVEKNYSDYPKKTGHKSRKEMLEEELLSLSLYSKNYEYVKKIKESYFSEKYLFIVREMNKSPVIDYVSLKSHFPEIIGIIDELELIAEVEIKEIDVDLQTQLSNIAKEFQKLVNFERRKELGGLLREAEQKNDKALVGKYSEELNALNKEYIQF